MMARLSSKTLALWISSTTAASSSSFTAAFAPFPRTRTFLQKSYTIRSMSSTIAATSGSNDKSDVPSTLKVALCQFPVTADKEINHKTATDYIQRAVGQGARLIVLPEIWNSPYATAAFPEYAEVLPGLSGSEDSPSSTMASPSASILYNCAKEHAIWIVGGSIPERDESGNISNTCLVFDPTGKVVAKHRKVHLFDINVPGGITFYESDTLSPGETVSHFNTPWGNVGIGICYDIRFAEYAMLLRQLHECCILIYPGAFNMTTGPAHWELLQRARALDNQCYVLTASPARSNAPETPGKYPHYTAWGHSTAVSPWGEVIATTDENEGIVIADLDLQRVETVRKSIPISQQKRTDLYKLEQL